MFPRFFGEMPETHMCFQAFSGKCTKHICVYRYSGQTDRNTPVSNHRKDKRMYLQSLAHSCFGIDSLRSFNMASAAETQPMDVQLAKMLDSVMGNEHPVGQEVATEPQPAAVDLEATAEAATAPASQTADGAPEPASETADGAPEPAVTQEDPGPDSVLVQTSAAEAAIAPVPSPERVKCGRCQLHRPLDECIHRPRSRENLRYICKPCNALAVQLGRHGIELRSTLSETSMTQFFQQANAERENTSDKRITYGQARAMLSRQMAEEASEVERHGEGAEWQPLAFWELKGYDVSSIAAKAETKMHPLLGQVFRVAVEKDSRESILKSTEARLCQMEADALQRRRASQATIQEAGRAALAGGAAPLPLPDGAVEEEEIDLGVSYAAEESVQKKDKKQKLTPEEKVAKQAEAKRLKAAQRAAEKLHHAGCTAAAKLLPQLQSVLGRLQKAREPTDCPVWTQMCEQNAGAVDATQNELQEMVTLGTKTLEAMSKGSSAAKLPAFPQEKEARRILKDGNDAIRVVQRFKKDHKEAFQALTEPAAKRRKHG